MIQENAIFQLQFLLHEVLNIGGISEMVEVSIRSHKEEN